MQTLAMSVLVYVPSVMLAALEILEAGTPLAGGGGGVPLGLGVVVATAVGAVIGVAVERRRTVS